MTTPTVIERLAEVKRAWSVPLLTTHESLVVLSQSFLGASTGGVQFNIMQIPCSAGQGHGHGPCWDHNR